MHSQTRSQRSIFGMIWNPANATLTTLFAPLFLICLLLFLTFNTQPAEGQTFRMLYVFTGGVDGDDPTAGLTMDAAGNLYGTTQSGGTGGCQSNYWGTGCGTVFRLSKQPSGWVLTTLYDFQGGTDGKYPAARVTFGPDGSLYGTTPQGGPGACAYLYQYLDDGCGTIFQLRPSPVPGPLGQPWVDTVIYGFMGGSDGATPNGDVVFDKTGNLYGTTTNGGLDSCDISSYFCGVVYQVMAVNHGWRENVVYSFTGGSDGDEPSSGVIFDTAGNLYGTSGPVFKLIPSGVHWTENTISQEGGRRGLIFDSSGNLYGSSYPDGNVFELTPSENGWVYTLLYRLSGGSRAALSMDAAGNLYGTQFNVGAYGHGTVFKLTPGSGGWTYTSLHDFTSSEWGYPLSNVIFDAAGNLYGTTQTGVWEITP